MFGDKMENFDLDQISNKFLKYFEDFGISKDNLIIALLILFLIMEKSDDYILIILLILLIK